MIFKAAIRYSPMHKITIIGFMNFTIEDRVVKNKGRAPSATPSLVYGKER